MSEHIILSILNFVPEFIKVLPSLILSITALVAIFYLRKPICEELIPRLSGLKFKDVELNFVKSAMDDALELAEKHEKWREKIKVTNKDKQNVLNRARRLIDIAKGTSILWIDDVPGNNKNEERMLKQLGMDIDYARNTAEALQFLERANYDLILSDIGREKVGGKKVDSGIETFEKIREKNIKLKLIFYIGDYNPDNGCPPHAFGITDRPDELLHLILDILERKKL